jgi:hypothetical protein
LVDRDALAVLGSAQAVDCARDSALLGELEVGADAFHLACWAADPFVTAQPFVALGSRAVFTGTRAAARKQACPHESQESGDSSTVPCDHGKSVCGSTKRVNPTFA